MQPALLVMNIQPESYKMLAPYIKTTYIYTATFIEGNTKNTNRM